MSAPATTLLWLTSSLSQQICTYSVQNETTLFRIPFLECLLKGGYQWFYLKGEIFLQISKRGEREFSFTCSNICIKGRYLVQLYFVRQAGDGPKHRISHLNFQNQTSFYNISSWLSIMFLLRWL